jgi:DeoR/GlpR family transcriptional regulator of sugar metabolism
MADGERPAFRQERLQRITEQVLAEHTVYVKDLARRYGVSESSIRLDLGELEARGVLERTHGGAILARRLDGRPLAIRAPLETRRQLLAAEKEAIGRAAAALVADGDTLFIDGGSTTWQVARCLGERRGLTVITNSLSLIPELLAIPDARIYVTGGLVDREFATLLGELAAETVGRFRVAKAILGIDGITADQGLSVTDLDVAAAKRRMMASAEQTIVVADHSKLNRVSLYAVAPVAAAAVLVTDAGAPPEILESLAALGPRVVPAGAD